MSGENAPRYEPGSPGGFYEVWYATLTDRASGVGAWIRYTLLAPVPGSGREPTCSLWFLTFDPNEAAPFARKATYPIGDFHAGADPFRVTIGRATMDEHGMKGAFEDVAWDLTWDGPGGAYRHVHPVLEHAGIAKTVLTLPHADVGVSGMLRIGDRELTLDGARAGQAHLWGTKHASRWAWAHANDLGEPGAFVDGVSVYVPRLGREVGPSTPVVAHAGGKDLLSVTPLRVLTNASRISLTSWQFEAGASGGRRLVAEVDAPRHLLAGVTYEDPDGAKAYCYNTEVASMRLQVWEQGRLVETLAAPGRAHFEYAQREPVPGVPLLL
jgi:hypothetical protein